MIVVFMVLLFVSALFLILLVLVQRGKGGGLAGAFGGMGGQSAFGTKAGDTFTKITVGVAAVWILLCILTVKMLATAAEGPMNLGGSDDGIMSTTTGEADGLGESGDDAGSALPAEDTPAESGDDPS